MKISSPLRYPGGKSVMASILGQIRTINRIGNRAIAEPYAGGAGASLSLLYLEEANNILINDADKAVFAFWWALVNRHAEFIDMLEKVNVNLHEWKRQQDIYRNPKKISRFELGFAAFYLNRCNRSGVIMNGGPIGGKEQSGKWKINARFNKEGLRRRCEKVAEYRNRIHVSNRDGVEFIENLNPESTFFFIDPPYFVKGKTLYLNALSCEYHLALSEKMKNMQEAAWVLTYDDCPQVRKNYKWATIKPFTLRYAACERRSGREVLICPKWMRLPDSQTSDAIGW